MGAAPVGGLAVGTLGLTAVAWGGAVTLGISLCVLVAVRELSDPTSDRAPDHTPADGARAATLDVLDGLRVAARVPGLRDALLLVGGGAGLMLPVPSLLVPLLGRTSGWGSSGTGLVAGAIGVGVISAALRAARRRAPAPSATPTAGLVVSAAGACVLTLASALEGATALTVAASGALVLGFGNGTFAARLAPVVLGSAPRTHLARVQALVGLAQLVPVMVAVTALGALAERTSPGWALGATATGLTACAAWAHRLLLARSRPSARSTTSTA